VGSHITNEEGREYLDFFAGAGSLNYGHNHPTLKAALIDYLQADGILHGLDMATEAKREFIETFERTILKPRRLDYKIQFTGPTGTNAVEAALKLARQVKARNNILCFTNAFHGVTTGSVAATGSSKFRDATGASLTDTQFVPYANYYGRDINTLDLIEKQLCDPGSGMDAPAAVLVECIQGEGGINTASADWLRGLAAMCRRHDMLLIVDDIQMGCGRTGSFFSFEQAGINPDIVTLSKSISGYGLPMALVLIKPEYDIWAPSAHNGTFRGNNAAFVTATAALNTFWADNSFADEVRVKGRLLHQRLEGLRKRHPHITAIRGRGMVAGIVLENSEMADAVSERCFEQGMIIETCGPHGEVVKMLPPLIMSEADLEAGLRIFDEALTHARRTFAPATIEEKIA
jgi:diaminobutyrate-2-oxoglutarate transaminase